MPPPELEEHAAFLLPLCDHLKGVQAAVAPVAVPTAERDERAVEAIVPGAIFINVPQTVLVPTDCKRNAIQSVRQGDPTGKMFKEGKDKREAAGQTSFCYLKTFSPLLTISQFY